MSVGPERLAIDPCLRDGVDGLITVEAQQLGHNSRRGYFDEDDVIKADAIEGIQQGKGTLNLVCFDHAFEDIMHGQGLTLTGKMVGDGKYSA